MMILAHLADSHLGPQGEKRDPGTGLNARLVDRAKCTRFCIADSIDRGAELILHAGDLLNSCRPRPTEGLLARQALQPAVDAGVPIILALGNHEAAGAGAHHALEWLRSWQGVTVIDQPCLLDVWRAGADDRLRVTPAREDGRPADSTELQVACLPWLNRSALLTDPALRKLSPADLNARMRDVVMERLWALAEQRADGIPCVLLAHCAVEEAQMGGGRLASLGRDWTLRVGDLAALGFDLVLLGHYHKYQVLHQDAPHIVYSGSPEACSFAEEGDGAKGYIDWQLGPNGWEGQFVESPYRRLVTLGGQPEEGELQYVRDAIVRLRIPQAMADQQRELVQELEAAGAFEVKVEVERSETMRRRDTEISAGMTPAQALDEWLKGHPDLLPLREQFHEEAARVEEAL